MLIKTLKLPLLSMFMAGLLHFTLEAIWPDLQSFYTTPILAFIQFSYGIWVGYKAVHDGGNFPFAILCGILLGLFPLVANPIAFWVILHRSLQPVMLAGVVGWSMVVWGSLVSGGFAVSMKDSEK